MDLPIIDVSDLLKTQVTDETKLRIGNSIKTALEEKGFFFISNHGCNSGQLFQKTKQFYKLPLEEKQKISATSFKGYTGLGSEITLGKRDLHECIDIMKNVKDTDSIFGTKNLYPDMEDFKPTVKEYIRSCTVLGKRIMESIGLSYGFPQEKAFSEDPFYILRLLHYPETDSVNVENAGIGVGPHTDYGCLTFLATNESGLEIENQNLEWETVPVRSDLLVCNIGDMLSFWSKGLLKATNHRVSTVQNERQSIAFFFEPNINTVVKPLNMKIEKISNLKEDFRYKTEIKYSKYLESKYVSSYPDTA